MIDQLDVTVIDSLYAFLTHLDGVTSISTHAESNLL